MELLVGPCGSGKSTFAARRAQRGALTVDFDLIVQSIHGGQDLFRHELEPLYKLIEAVIIEVTLKGNGIVIIDKPNLKAYLRSQYIEYAHKMNDSVMVVLFPMSKPEHHAMRRYKSDARGQSYNYWLEIAEKQFGEFEYPDEKVEGFDELFVIEDYFDK